MRPDYSDALTNLGGVFVAQGDLESARQSLDRVAELLPDDARAQFNVGHVLKKQGSIEASRPYFERALELDSSHLGALVGLAELLATHPIESLRDRQRAVELTRQAIPLAMSAGQTELAALLQKQLQEWSQQ